MSGIPYCGVKKVPKNRSRGSALECMLQGKVNYWGVQKLSEKLLPLHGKKKEFSSKRNIEEALRKTHNEVIQLKARAAVQQKKWEYAREKDAKEKAREDYKKTAAAHKEVIVKYRELLKRKADLEKAAEDAKKREDQKAKEKSKKKSKK